MGEIYEIDISKEVRLGEPMRADTENPCNLATIRRMSSNIENTMVDSRRGDFIRISIFGYVEISLSSSTS
jgi:hypothetical protein